MIYVSDAWKNAHKQMILPESFVEITMGVIDDSVTGTVSGTNEAAFAHSLAVVNNEEYEGRPEYALLEHNLWSLDGSKTVLANTNSCYTSAYVTANDSTGSLTIKLPAVNNNSIPGFVIVWSAEYESYASEFTVDVKRGTSVVGTVTVRNNTSYISAIDLPVYGYDSVTITVQEWSHPEQRNRIDSVMFGQRIVFTKDDIISYSHEQSGSPLGTELSKNAIEFEIDNSDGRWNPMNPSGMAKYLYERQKVKVRYGLETLAGVEWIPGGTFYLSEWKAPSNGISATFTARDVFEFMLSSTYSRPYVNGVTVDTGKVYLTKDDAVYVNSDTHLVTTLPSGTAVKVYEKAVWYPEGTGDNPEDPGVMVYRIDQGWLWADYVQITSVSNLFMDMSSALSACVPSDVTMIAGDEITGASVSAPTGIVGMNTAEFVQQCVASYGVTAWQNAEGVLLLLSPSASLSDYVITANTSYTHPEVELTKPLRRVNMVQHYQFSSDTQNAQYDVSSAGEDITVDCAYLWRYDSRTDALAEKYINWWKHREVVSGDFRADPRLELFDVVQVETKYGTLSPVMITYLKYSYNGSFRCSYEGKVIDGQGQIPTPDPDPNPDQGTDLVNLIPISTDTNGSIFNTTGYKSGYRIDGSGSILECDATTITGFIPFKQGDVLRITLDGFAGDSRDSISVYDATKTHLRNQYVSDGAYFTKESKAYAFDVTGSGTLAPAACVRITGSGITNKTVVTVNQEIE